VCVCLCVCVCVCVCVHVIQLQALHCPLTPSLKNLVQLGLVQELRVAGLDGLLKQEQEGQ
jgi:hypothetical protein